MITTEDEKDITLNSAWRFKGHYNNLRSGSTSVYEITDLPIVDGKGLVSFKTASGSSTGEIHNHWGDFKLFLRHFFPAKGLDEVRLLRLKVLILQLMKHISKNELYELIISTEI